MYTKCGTCTYDYLEIWNMSKYYGGCFHWRHTEWMLTWTKSTLRQSFHAHVRIPLCYEREMGSQMLFWQLSAVSYKKKLWIILQQAFSFMFNDSFIAVAFRKPIDAFDSWALYQIQVGVQFALRAEIFGFNEYQKAIESHLVSKPLCVKITLSLAHWPNSVAA